jgi:hypothetical protein
MKLISGLFVNTSNTRVIRDTKRVHEIKLQMQYTLYSSRDQSLTVNSEVDMYWLYIQ